MGARLEAFGLEKFYGDAAAVNGVDLDAQPGEFVSLLGPSGCGKTTSLRMIAGLERPDSGHITIDGRDVTYVSPQSRGLGMVFQQYALFPNLSAFENIAFALRVRRKPQAEIVQRVSDLLAMVHLEDAADRYPHQLSGGMQQRVALARALAMEPPLLLLDEPLSALDAAIRDELRTELRRLQRQLDLTVIYVTHDQAEAMTTADLIAVMNQGRVEQLGPPEEIYGQPRSEFVARFIGGANILRGQAVDDARVSIAGTALRASGRTLRAGSPVTLSVRQHEIAITAEAAPPAGDNRLPGVVVRQVFLGAARDYTVQLDDRTEVRVTAPPGRGIPVGTRVWLDLPAEQLRALAEA
jgi:iron(III) transport system ATP-binding protein